MHLSSVIPTNEVDHAHVGISIPAGNTFEFFSGRSGSRNLGRSVGNNLKCVTLLRSSLLPHDLSVFHGPSAGKFRGNSQTIGCFSLYPPHAHSDHESLKIVTALLPHDLSVFHGPSA